MTLLLLKASKKTACSHPHLLDYVKRTKPAAGTHACHQCGKVFSVADLHTLVADGKNSATPPADASERMERKAGESVSGKGPVSP